MIDKDNLECKICLDNDKIENFMSPCECKGSLKYIHKICLEKSIKSSKDSSKCEICNYKFIIMKKFEVYNFIKIINYFNLFIIINYLSIIVYLIYFLDYILLLPIYLILPLILIINLINYLINDINIKLIIKKNILAHISYSFIYVLYEYFSNKAKYIATDKYFFIYNLYLFFTIFYYINFVYQIHDLFIKYVIINKK